MTVEDLVVSVYEGLGEPSELFPYQAGTTTFDITTVGSVKILKWVNRAYKRIVNWKFPNGSQVRFPSQEGSCFFKGMVKTGTVASATSTTAVLDSGVEAEADRYNGCILKILTNTGSGQVRLIVDYAADRTATVDHAWNTNPDATSTYGVYKRDYKFRGSTASDVSDNIALSPVNQIAAIRKITDVKNLADLALAGRLETFTENLTEVGDPETYLPQGDGLIFNTAPETELWFRLEYTRVPAELTSASDQPELPDSFNEALILYATWIGLRRSQEWGGAYATKKDIEDVMSSLKTSLEMSFEREDIGALIV